MKITKRRLRKWVWVALAALVLLALAIGTMWPKKKLEPMVIVTNSIQYNGVPNIIESPKVEQEQEQPKKTEIVQETVKIEQEVLSSQDLIVGSMTAYGSDCTGCSGITASGYDVRNTIHYTDSTYGNIRILAAPKNIPLYSIIRVSGVKGQEPFLAIVLDRGGAIKGTLFDLLCESEKDSYAIGRQKNITYEIIRSGK